MKLVADLRACPFCGGPAELVTGGNYTAFVKCLICSATGKSFSTNEAGNQEARQETEKRATIAWNMRKGESK